LERDEVRVNTREGEKDVKRNKEYGGVLENGR